MPRQNASLCSLLGGEPPVPPSATYCHDLLLADLSKNHLLTQGLLFSFFMKHFWRHHSLSKMILKRCQLAEYKPVRQLQRPGAARWKSQVSAAKSLLLTEAAIQKAAVDTVLAIQKAAVETVFREQCVRSPAAVQRVAANEAVELIRDGRTGRP